MDKKAPIRPSPSAELILRRAMDDASASFKRMHEAAPVPKLGLSPSPRSPRPAPAARGSPPVPPSSSPARMKSSRSDPTCASDCEEALARTTVVVDALGRAAFSALDSPTSCDARSLGAASASDPAPTHAPPDQPSLALTEGAAGAAHVYGKAERWPDDCDRLVRVVVVGASGVGKSTLAHKFFGIPFDKQATIGVDVLVRPVRMGGAAARVEIYDTAGTERFAPSSRSTPAEPT